MRRLLVPAAVAVVAVVVCLALAALVLRGGSGGGAETKREADVRPTVTPTLQPSVHRFGEPVTAQLDLTVRQADLDPRTGTPSSSFEPYTAVGPARKEVTDFGALSRVRFTVTVQCLRQDCLPRGQTADFDFGLASVGWRVPPPPGRKFKDLRLDSRSARATWPALRVTSWLTPTDVQEARWRSTLGELPPPSYAVAPEWLSGLLLGAALLLVLLAAALAAGPLRRVLARRAAPEEAAVATPPLERAVSLVEESRADGDVAGRRVALETLARELRQDGERDLAADAERLAWSPGAPHDAQVATLIDGVRARLNGGGA